MLDPEAQAQKLVSEYSKLLKDPSCHYAKMAATKTVHEIVENSESKTRYFQFYWTEVANYINRFNSKINKIDE